MIPVTIKGVRSARDIRTHGKQSRCGLFFLLCFVAGRIVKLGGYGG